MLSHRLCHRVEFQRPVDVQDELTGEVVTKWQKVILPGGAVMTAVPAEVLTGPGREFVASSAKQAEATARINLRWFPVDRLELCRWRVLWDGRIYNIVSAETDLTARREWRLRCEDGPSRGE